MPELEEFAEALLDQIAVETDEEKVIADLVEKIASDSPFDVKFEPLEEAVKKFFAPMGEKMSEFTGLDCSSTVLKFAGLREFKTLKGRKVIAGGDSRQYIDRLFSAVSDADVGAISDLIREDRSKFFVYSTYAKSYLSKISIGDYMVHLFSSMVQFLLEIYHPLLRVCPLISSTCQFYHIVILWHLCVRF